jgi:hypothetical protein
MPRMEAAGWQLLAHLSHDANLLFVRSSAKAAVEVTE